MCSTMRTSRHTRKVVNTTRLWVATCGRLLTLGFRAIQHVVKKYLKEAGTNGASVHTLRHTFATHHVAQGTSLRTVQEMLGHADLKTTSIYVQL